MAAGNERYEIILSEIADAKDALNKTEVGSKEYDICLRGLTDLIGKLNDVTATDNQSYKDMLAYEEDKKAKKHEMIKGYIDSGANVVLGTLKIFIPIVVIKAITDIEKEGVCRSKSWSFLGRILP